MKTAPCLISFFAILTAALDLRAENSETSSTTSQLRRAEAPRQDVSTTGPWGNCKGAIRLEFDPNGRDVILLDEVHYTDRKGVVWTAPKRARVDGASIPRLFWAVVGGPFEGKYRAASVFHDVACEQRRRTWRRTHEMFYEAMMCSGVSSKRAKLMYYAVLRFGPRWAEPVRGRATPKLIPSTLPAPTKDEVNELQAWIDREDPSLTQLSQRANAGKK